MVLGISTVAKIYKKKSATIVIILALILIGIAIFPLI
jgi:hypothetical protein